jgi:hypothetical protein
MTLHLLTGETVYEYVGLGLVGDPALEVGTLVCGLAVVLAHEYNV